MFFFFFFFRSLLLCVRKFGFVFFFLGLLCKVVENRGESNVTMCMYRLGEMVFVHQWRTDNQYPLERVIYSLERPRIFIVNNLAPFSLV